MSRMDMGVGGGIHVVLLYKTLWPECAHSLYWFCGAYVSDLWSLGRVG